MDLSNIKIITDRLILMPINFEYSEVIYKEFNKKIAKYMIPQPEEYIEQIFEFIKICKNDLLSFENLHLVIIDKESREFLGGAGVYHLKQLNPELGIWLKEDAHNKSIGYETINGLIKWAIINLNYEYLSYPVDRRNIASLRIAEKNNGIKYKSYIEKNRNGDILETVEYRIYKY